MNTKAGGGRAHCDFEATFQLLGRKYVLQLLRALVEASPRRFNELGEAVGANTATLTDRLRSLERLGLVRREVIRVIPRRVEYALTPMGRDLVKLFTPMLRWRAKYSA
ncbi:MAG: helix-turn-helix transcriptional regulator [Thermoplasmata archaeon]|nr:helix-turn-helix transcriptional regulator [Thermoplasmata archaeon]